MKSSYTTRFEGGVRPERSPGHTRTVIGQLRP
jgi:hypothetical protein